MRKLLAIFGFLFVGFLLLFAYAYSNQPNETMSTLYQKIPEEVRENAQLIAAYYSSQNGDREYQFAFYDPKERTLSIYTFKIITLFKITLNEKKSKISCKTPFNYSILATSPEKLKNFKNCDNCKLFLYKGRIYKNEEIENIYPSIEEMIRGKENTTYVNLVLMKDREISMGVITERVGDCGLVRGLLGYWGLLHMPSTMSSSWRGVIIEFTTESNGTINVIAHYPGNVTLSTIAEVKAPSNKTWELKEVPLEDIIQALKSKRLASSVKGSLRFEFSITREGERIEAWAAWVNPEKGVLAFWRISPPGKITRNEFNEFDGYLCTRYGSDILEKLP